MDSSLIASFTALGTALGLGMLVGLQRERGRARLGGIRTFPLITILGALAGLAHDIVGPWVIAIAGLGVVFSLLVGAIERASRRSAETNGTPPPAYELDREVGLTTEFAILVMFVVGIIVAIGPPSVGVVTAGLVLLLLHMKDALHDFASRVGEHDARAVAQFTLISLVILPVLPNETFGPYEVINPRQAWLMVVLVVGIGLVGYVARRLVGPKAGVALSGLLGGTISSTATTATFARQAKAAIVGAPAACLAILIAGIVSFARVLAELGVVAPKSLPDMAMPFLIVMLTLVLASAVAWIAGGHRTDTESELRNPAELKAALFFGALYTAVLLAVAAADDLLGERGLYAVAVVSGLTDMNAITLSTGQLVTDGALEAATGWRVILIASMSNMVFKVCLAWGLGGWRVAWRAGVGFAAAFLVAGALLVWW